MATYLGFRATAWAWGAPAASASERLVLLALARFAGDAPAAGGWRTYPTTTTIEEITQLSRNTIYKALSSLSAAGVIVREKRPDGPPNANSYILVEAAAGPSNSSTPAEISRTKIGTTNNGTTKSDTTKKTATDVPNLVQRSYRNWYDGSTKIDTRIEKEEKKNREEVEAAAEDCASELPPGWVLDTETVAVADEPIDARGWSRDYRQSATASTLQRVRLPYTELPEKWRAVCEQRRPDLDADLLWLKFQAEYGPEGAKCRTELYAGEWLKRWLNWVAKEKAPDLRQQPQQQHFEQLTIEGWHQRLRELGIDPDAYDLNSADAEALAAGESRLEAHMATLGLDIFGGKLE